MPGRVRADRARSRFGRFFHQDQRDQSPRRVPAQRREDLHDWCSGGRLHFRRRPQRSNPDGSATGQRFCCQTKHGRIDHRTPAEDGRELARVLSGHDAECICPGGHGAGRTGANGCRLVWVARSWHLGAFRRRGIQCWSCAGCGRSCCGICQSTAAIRQANRRLSEHPAQTGGNEHPGACHEPDGCPCRGSCWRAGRMRPNRSAWRNTIVPSNCSMSWHAACGSWGGGPISNLRTWSVTTVRRRWRSTPGGTVEIQKHLIARCMGLPAV